MEVSIDEVETTFRVFYGQMGRLVTSPFLPVPSSSSQSSILNEAFSVRVTLQQDNDHYETHVGKKSYLGKFGLLVQP